MLRKYPIGLQRFRKIREGSYVYIDKTKIIHQLVETGQYYFLSRPIRFGKSLLVDTIEELFNGHKELFRGLWIHDKWDWSETRPVIHFDFAELPYKEVGLSEALKRAIIRNAEKLGVSIFSDNIKDAFRELIEKASVKENVVILIDEYDKPIIDFLDEPDQLDANRSIMKSFFSILKARDEQIRLLLITGVSQFSQVSIFSDLNNLRNITLTTQYGEIIGITQKELEENFTQEIFKMQQDRPDILAQIKRWYNGYTWNMRSWVYNPFSLLNFMADPVFRNFWFATGTPTFLLTQLKKKSIYDVENLEMGSLALSSFDTDHPNLGALLFQTGYLTIKNIEQDSQELFTLGYPNLEVKSSLLNGLLSIYREGPAGDSLGLVSRIRKR